MSSTWRRSANCSEREAGAHFSKPPPSGRLTTRGLKEFDGVAGRIVQHDLRSARSTRDLVTKRDSGRAESVDLADQIVNDEVDSVPAAGRGRSAVRHRSAGGACRSAEQKPKIAACHVGK